MAVRYIITAWLLAAIVLLSGCNRQAFDDGELEHVDGSARSAKAEKTVVDSWYRATPSSFIPAFATPLDNKEVYQVTDAVEPQAESLLKNSPFQPLSPQQTRDFTNGQYKEVVGKLPYLVRAVYLNKETGSFVVYHQSNNLHVLHGSLGHSPTSMKRQALVVALPTTPAEVFVDCSMAQ